MVLNSIGEIVEKEWKHTKTIRTNIDLDYFAVMPNHIHGIIIINKNVETTGSVVSYNKKETMPPHRGKANAPSITLPPNSLGSIIGQIKSVCTKQIRCLGYKKFAWQERYY